LQRIARHPLAFVGADGIVVLEELKIAYVAIPKVANSTVKAVCADILGDALGDLQNESWRPAPFRSPEGQAILRQRGILIDPGMLRRRSDLEVFTLVRHPLDRLASCWASKIDGRNADAGLGSKFRELGGFAPHMPFSDFVRRTAEIPDWKAEGHFRSQASYLVDGRRGLVADTVLRFEELPECLHTYLTSRGAQHVEVPHLLQSSRPSWQSMYDAETEELARERFADDLTLFGYA
jgi:hypothetical protein